MASEMSDLYGKGNEAFVIEDYDLAINLFTQAIEEDPSQPDFYCNRGNAFLKLQKYEEAKSDLNKSLELGKKEAKLYLWKGTACFYLKQYEEAEQVFSEGKALEVGDGEGTFNVWLDQCKSKLEEMKIKDSVTSPQPPPLAKIRHDWYQTESSVVVTILVKNAQQDDVSVQITDKSLQCTVRGNDRRQDFVLDVTLAHEVSPNHSTWKILPSKIEIQLKKAEGVQWKSLRATAEKENIKHFTPGTSTVTKNYPTSSSMKKDWDKLVVEIKKDEESDQGEGEAAVNRLFQRIYAEGSDEVKKAMNKSFTESGGTVLSTNWGDVGKKKIKVKPPDGMEWKRWDY